jgi:hypothetical protein
VPKRPASPDPGTPLDLWSSLDRAGVGRTPFDAASVEADDAELIAHVDRRLGRGTPRPGTPTEPAWLAEALEAAWPRLLREADAGMLRG